MEQSVIAVKLETLHGDVGEIKTALNKLSEAITKLALVEQQQSQTAEALERAFKAIAKMDERVASLEKSNIKTSASTIWVDRAVMGTLGAAGITALRAVGIF